MNNEKRTDSNNEQEVEFNKDHPRDLQEQQRNRIETAAEKSVDRHGEADKARHEIEKATAEKESKKQEKTAEQSPVERKADNKSARKKAYDSIMKQTQAELPAPSRAFSKVIHNPVVDKASEFAGKTIARPNAILSGAAFAFLLTVIVYVIAKLNGYPLTGTETIAAFILGWVMGNMYDFFKVMISGQRS